MEGSGTISLMCDGVRDQDERSWSFQHHIVEVSDLGRSPTPGRLRSRHLMSIRPLPLGFCDPVIRVKAVRLTKPLAQTNVNRLARVDRHRWHDHIPTTSSP